MRILPLQNEKVRRENRTLDQLLDSWIFFSPFVFRLQVILRQVVFTNIFLTKAVLRMLGGSFTIVQELTL